MGAASTVKSASRVLDILEFLAEHAREGRSLTVLAKQLPIPKSSLHELLGVLVARGYVEHDSVSHRYRLGPRSCMLGASYLAHLDLYQVAQPVMAAIGRLSSETITLDILDGNTMITIAREEARHAFRLATRIGAPFPAHATASGKVMLASLPDTVLDTLLQNLDLRPFTANTVPTALGLREQLKEVRRSGVAHAHGELYDGVEATAAPIIGHEGQTIAALDVVVPSHRAEPKHLQRIECVLRASARIISARMGAPNIATELVVDVDAYLQRLWDTDGVVLTGGVYA